MSETVVPDTALATPFIRCLVALIRAEDSYGAWEHHDDAWLLRDYLVSVEQRRQIPIIGDPDPDTLSRLDSFYRAAGLTIEQHAGMIASPMLSMNHEGFGRVVLIVGRLVVYSRNLRDVHRFGFVDLPALAEAGQRVVDSAEASIAAFPEVARG